MGIIDRIRSIHPSRCNDDRCCMPKCSRPDYILYLKRPLCEKHWKQLCEETEDVVVEGLARDAR